MAIKPHLAQRVGYPQVPAHPIAKEQQAGNGRNDAQRGLAELRRPGRNDTPDEFRDQPKTQENGAASQRGLPMRAVDSLPRTQHESKPDEGADPEYPRCASTRVRILEQGEGGESDGKAYQEAQRPLGRGSPTVLGFELLQGGGGATAYATGTRVR